MNCVQYVLQFLYRKNHANFAPKRGAAVLRFARNNVLGCLCSAFTFYSYDSGREKGLSRNQL